MKRTTSTTIATLVVAVIAAGAAAPALAHDFGPGASRDGFSMRQDHRGENRDGRMDRGDNRDGRMDRGMRGGRGGLLALVCGPQGDDRLEHMLLNIAQATNPTADQQPLYEALKSAATTAQADFAAACTAAMPADGETAQSGNLVDRLGTRLELDQARVAALGAVVPALEAFYDSLTDAQKQALEPRRDGRHHGDARRMGGKPAPETAAPSNS